MKHRYLVILLLLLPFVTFGGGRKASILATGTWYRISVTQTGVHRITYEDLTALGMNPAAINPANIRVYGNGGAMVPEKVGVERTNDLRENPIWVEDGNDGQFNEGDYILFYGEGTDRIRYNENTKLFDHERNIYSDTSFYFITADLGPGRRIETLPSDTSAANSYSTRFTEFIYHDVDLKSLIRSGRIWVGEEFNDTIQEYNFRYILPNLDVMSGVRFTLSTVARCPYVSFFYLYANDSLVDEIQMDFTDLQSISIYARSKQKSSIFFYPKDTLNVKLAYPLLSTSSIGWLNYLEMTYQRRLKWVGPQMSFRDPNTIGTGKVTEFKMTDSHDGIVVWEITDPDSVRRIGPIQTDSLFRFRVPTETLRQFIAFDGTSFFPVNPIGPVANQNLHATLPAQLVIITHPEFETQAKKLAEFHQEHNGVTALVERTDRIYNEFSSGRQDASAIRDYIKMMYDNGGPNRPKYVLMIGDGSYDYKDRVPNNSNFVPTYESLESFKYIGTFVTDDFYGLMNTNEGEEADGSLELGIGRLPVATAEEAEAVVGKIIHYYDRTDTTLLPWKNNITFIADDEDGNLHANQAEELAGIVNSKYPQFNVSKIYNDAYQLVKIPSGVRYPDVNKAINKTVADGNLIINYTGHGGEDGWSGEQVLTVADIESWANKGKLPVFVTATCEFSRFDNPERFSAGEMIITKPDAGAVALFTTTRLALATSNFKLDTSFFRHLMDKGNGGEYLKLGDLIRIAKNMNANNNNIKNFVLLGDPAQVIVFPDYRVETTEINGTPAGAVDTVLGLQMIEVKGKITDESGNLQSGFDGEVYPKVFDKPVTYTTLGNQAKSYPMNFQCQNSVLSDGKATVTDGLFSFRCTLPLDINLQFGKGKISYYARTGDSDASGYTDNLVIGGTDPAIDPINAGPDIRLYMEDRSFTENGLTSLNPLLIADLRDTNGINSVGLGIGHEILMVLDDDWAHPVVLNDYFIPDLDKYDQGSVYFTLEDLEPGRHTLTLNAWDLYNNPSEKTLSFFAFEHPALTVSGVNNFPNPFREGTTFTFTPEAGTGTMEVTIEICSLAGQPVRTLSFACPGTGQQPYLYYWDGTDEGGNRLRCGLYPYRVLFRSKSGAVSQASRKLVIIR